MYYSLNDILSYNKLLNIVVGARGIGKTYAAKRHVINNFIKKGEKFIYLRRFKEEIKGDTFEKFFDDIAPEFKNCEFKCSNKKFYINGKVAGYVVALSTAKIFKSVPYPDITAIIFDEFIIDKGFYHYIPDEVTNFLEFISTVVRLRTNLRVFMLSNAITVANPYFLYFNIDLNGSRFTRVGKQIIVEYAETDKTFKQQAGETPFGQLIEGTAYGNYSMHNHFLRDSNEFLKCKTGKSQIYFNFKISGNYYGCWVDYTTKEFYISYDYVKDYPVVFAFSKNDHDETTTLVKCNRNDRLRNFVTSYQKGQLFFEDIKLKNLTLDILKSQIR